MKLPARYHNNFCTETICEVLNASQHSRALNHRLRAWYSLVLLRLHVTNFANVRVEACSGQHAFSLWAYGQHELPAQTRGGQSL